MPTLRALCIANAVVSAPFALAFLIAPGTTAALYGIAMAPDSAVIARLFGALLLAVAILTALARDAVASSFGRAVAIAFLVDGGIGAVMLAHGALTGTLNDFAWTSVAIYLAYAVTFGYHAVRP